MPDASASVFREVGASAASHRGVERIIERLHFFSCRATLRNERCDPRHSLRCRLTLRLWHADEGRGASLAGSAGLAAMRTACLRERPTGRLRALPGFLLDTQCDARGELIVFDRVDEWLCELDRVEGFRGYGSPGSLFRRTLVTIDMGDGRSRGPAWAHVFYGKPSARVAPSNCCQTKRGQAETFTRSIVAAHMAGRSSRRSLDSWRVGGRGRATRAGAHRRRHALGAVVRAAKRRCERSVRRKREVGYIVRKAARVNAGARQASVARLLCLVDGAAFAKKELFSTLLMPKPPSAPMPVWTMGYFHGLSDRRDVTVAIDDRFGKRSGRAWRRPSHPGSGRF